MYAKWDLFFALWTLIIVYNYVAGLTSYIFQNIMPTSHARGRK